MQFENRLKKLELELPEKIKNRAKKQQESLAKVLELLSMRVYQSAWIREQNGIHDPMSEAVDRFYLKKRKEREQNYERQRLARLGLEQPELRCPKIDKAAREVVTPVTGEVAKSTESTETAIGIDEPAPRPTPQAKVVPRPPAVGPCPLTLNSRQQGKGRTLGATGSRQWPFGRRRY